jgi:hypothetical protein
LSKLVNVVLPDGRTVAVSAEDAGRISGAGRGRQETDQEDISRATASANAERASGLAEGAKTLVEGGLDGLSGGAFGKIAGAFSPEYGEDLANRGQQNPGLRMLGEAGSMLTGAGVAGLAAKAGAKTGAAFGSRVAGQVAEGAILGAGAQIASTNITGDPLTIEGALEGAGMGAFFNYGAGLISGKLTKMGAKATAKQADEAAWRSNAETATAGAKKFNEPSAAWNEYVESHVSAHKARAELTKRAQDRAEEYDLWVNPATAPKKLHAELKVIDKARAEVGARIAKTTYGQAVGAADNAASGAAKQYAGDIKNADKFLGSTKRWPKALDEVDAAINEVQGRYAPSSADEALYKPKLQGYTGEVVDGKFTKSAAYRTATEKAPISAELEGALAEFKLRRSNITKMKDGGYRLDGPNKWVKDPSVQPDPYGALEELHKLRKDFTGRFRSVKFPDLPNVPAAPEGFKYPQADGSVLDVKQLAGASRGIREAADEARAKMRDGDFEGALESMRNAKARAEAAGVKDLVLPNIPDLPPPAPAVAPQIKLPGSLREFGRMHSDTVAKLAANADEVTESAFAKLAADLDVDPAHGIAGVHSKLNSWLGAIDNVKASAAGKAAGDPGLIGVLRSGAKNAFTGALGFGAYGAVGGGILGAAAGAMTRTGARAAANAVEDSLLNGSLMASREGIRSRVRDIVAKHAAKTAGGITRLAPVTTYLGVSLFGTEDAEPDVRRQTVNRINEMQRAAMIAPDAAFLAVEGLLGHPGDIGGKMHAAVVGAVNHLAQTAPRDPGLNTKMFKSEWTPAHHEVVAYAHRIEAVMNPLDAIARSIRGEGHPAATETLWIVWPSMMSHAAQELAYAAPQMSRLSYEKASGYSQLFRTPLTALQQPAIATAIQGMYLPRPEPAAPRNGSRPTGNAPGRPAAVQSPVAGSSVAGLTS